MDYKLMCFGTHDDKNSRCGICLDEGTCMRETKLKNEIKGESNCKNARK